MIDDSCFMLDTTLRCLVYTLRSKGGVLMAVEFMHRGKRWRADTPEEAIELREKLEEQDQELSLTDPEFEEQLQQEKNKWTPDRFVGVVENLGFFQKQFLSVLLTRNTISAHEIAKKLKLSSLMALAGVQSKVTKEVRRIGLEPTDLYQVQIDWREGDRVRYFKVDAGFRAAAEDAGWPPAGAKFAVEK